MNPDILHTSNSFAANASHQAIDPIGVLLGLSANDRVAFLENLVDGNKGLERLDLVGQDRLPVGVISMSAQVHSHFLVSPKYSASTYTFMPAQKAADDLWSHVYTMQLRTCLPV